MVKHLCGGVKDMGRITIRFGSGSDIGKERAGNEDSYRVVCSAAVPDAIDAIFVVADGMGGHAAGEVASQMTVESVVGTLVSRDNQLGILGAFEILDLMRSAMARANQVVMEEGARSPEKRGMGTTCTLGVIQGDDLHLAHIGDSRGYLFRGRDLSRITEDHSVVEEEVRRGLLTAEQARVDPRRNLITAAIGLGLDPTVDTKSVKLLSGDRIMFCTDGLNSMITDQEIGTILDRNDPQASCQGLIDAANDAGGEDNITIIVVDVIR